MNEFTHLDLFSGIGGFALAASWAGFRTVAFSEVEPYTCKVLAERFGNPQSPIPNLGDIRIASNFAGLGPITVLTGGFPCQPFSTAGKRRGKEDDRHLWPAMRDVIEVVRPTWVLGENVPGLDHMGQLDACLHDLESLGYESQPFEIPACAVDAPHLRERLWIVAHALPSRQRRKSREKENEGHAMADTVGSPEHSPGTQCDVRTVENGNGRGWRVGSNWLPEPNVDRVVDGVPKRSHRINGLGNAIVPQVAAPFFHWIAQIEKGEIT